MNSPIPPFPEKPKAPLFSSEDRRLIRKWLMERVAVQNLIERVSSLPMLSKGPNIVRTTIHG